MVLGIHQDQYTCTCLPVTQKKNEGLEVKSGQLYMIQTVNNKLRRMPVFVRVYRNQFEHYIVIYRNQTFTNKSVFVSLKNCHVEVCDKSNNEIRVIPGKIEGTKVTFQMKDSNDVAEWVSVLRPLNCCKGGLNSVSKASKIPKTLVMPMLDESEEDLG